MSKSVCI